MGDAPEGNLGRTFAILVIMAFLIPFLVAMSGPVLNGTEAIEKQKALPGFTMEELSTNSIWNYGGIAQGANVSNIGRGSYWVPQEGIIINSIAAHYSTDAPEIYFEEAAPTDPGLHLFVVHQTGDPNAVRPSDRYTDFVVIAQWWGYWDYKYAVLDLTTASKDYDSERGGIDYHFQLKEKMTAWIKANGTANIISGDFTIYIGQSITDQAQGSNDIFGMLASAITLSWTTGDSMLDWLIKLPLIFAYVYVAFRLVAMLIPFT
jgi:hypothetical protein